MMYRWLCSILLAGVLLPTTVEAAVINYNESVDGDLASQPSVSGVLDVFTLGIGPNTFSGELTFSSQVDAMNNILSDFDSIAFKLPSDTKLTSILIDTSLLPGGFGREFSDIRYELRDALAQYLGKTDPTAVKGALADLQERVINLERKLGRLAG